MRSSVLTPVLATALVALATAALAQATGEQDRSYSFPGTGEQIPYHLYVPTTWTKTAKLPLIVVTHGANQPATAPFEHFFDAHRTRAR